MPWRRIRRRGRCRHSCSGNMANFGDTTSPNGDIGMDAVADDLIHELSETAYRSRFERVVHQERSRERRPVQLCLRHNVPGAQRIPCQSRFRDPQLPGADDLGPRGQLLCTESLVSVSVEGSLEDTSVRRSLYIVLARRYAYSRTLKYV